MSISRILLVDDDESALRLFCRLLQDHTQAEIEFTKHPAQGLRMATDNFYDICLLDITMHYHGSPFGGLDLYKQLAGKYGSNSLLAYSQYVSDDLLQRYGTSFNFIEQGSSPMAFAKELCDFMVRLRSKQTCFIAMPFDKSYDQLYRVIRDSVRLSHYIPIRLDAIPFTKSIVEKMFEEIRNSKIVVFVATDQNPNAFYECGYSIALGKETVTITDYHKNLPFDIRDRNALAYGRSAASLQDALVRRLKSLSSGR